MNDDAPAPDPRLVFGAIIPGEIWFDIGPQPLRAAMYGRLALDGPGSVHLIYPLTLQGEIDLESPPGALAKLTGVLNISSQRADVSYLGHIDRQGPAGYAVDLHLFEPEMARVMSLLAAGLRPRRLKIEFDSLFDPGFLRENYWDDVRYPRVELSEYALDWRPDGAGGEG